MTVGELIAALEQFDPSMDVGYMNWDRDYSTFYFTDISSVEQHDAEDGKPRMELL